MSHHGSHADVADILIVGGGSAGAVLAARLSQDPDRRVTLLEAGPAYAAPDFPAGLRDATVIADPAHDWGYTSRAGAGSQSIPTPRGKVLGGSSAVNAGAALRPRPADFAVWSEHGLTDWTFDDVLPVFRALESTPTGADVYHGRTGPMPVRQHGHEDLSPAQRGFIEAGVALGHKRIADFNGAEQRGIGGHAVNVVDGVRQNTATVYLTPEVRSRPNLAVSGGVTVDRVLFEGTTAVGVVAADGTEYRGREVILSAGSYGTAAILLRSGIGPADDLTALGIPVLVDLPVGQRLQDHPFFHTIYALAADDLTMTPAIGALLWTASSEAVGDELDLHVVAAHPHEAPFSPTGGAVILSAALVRPESRGSVRLADRDPLTAPVIDDNYLGTERDRRRMLEGAKLVRALVAEPSLTPLLAGELTPGFDGDDDAELVRVIETNLSVYGHPTSTAPMGGDGDPWAVVDARGAVKGLNGLRAIDASIIPQIPSTVTNLTVIMIAERLARLVYEA